MACCANALKAGFIPTLINSSALGDGALETCRVGAEEHFRSPVDMAICKKATWAELSVRAHVSNGNDDPRVLDPLWKWLGCFADGWKGVNILTSLVAGGGGAGATSEARSMGCRAGGERPGGGAAVLAGEAEEGGGGLGGRGGLAEAKRPRLGLGVMGVPSSSKRSGCVTACCS